MSGISLEGLTPESAILLPEKRREELREQLVFEKWNGLGWLDERSEEKGFPKLATQRDKVNMAMILENQLGFQNSKRRRVTADGYVDQSIMLDESTSDLSLPTTFSLAMIRRAYALITNEDWAVRQPLHGPTGFVWYVDFEREGDGSNVLSGEYGAFVAAEQSVPKKAKMKLTREAVSAEKQLLATTWTLEAAEDAMAQLGLNVEQEMISTFTAEFVRNIFQRHLLTIYNGSLANTAVGWNLPQPWGESGQSASVIPAQGTMAAEDWRAAIYHAILDANGAYVKANRQQADGIVAGIDLATRLDKANQEVHVTNRGDGFDNDLGVESFGHFQGRFHIWATDLLPANVGFLYRRNPDNLRSSFIYCPYVPIQVMPAVYGGFDAATGNYQNTDEYTRNIRERSTERLVKPYGFVPLVLG